MSRASKAGRDARVPVRLLVDSHLGRADSVVEMEPEAAKSAARDGLADPHPDAVAYARSLITPSPKP